jgi:hypothetical protein
MRLILGMAVCLTVASCSAQRQPVPAVKQGDALVTEQTPGENAAFEKMKTLVGEWECQRPNQPRLLNTFRIFGEGSALLHLEKPEGRQERITIFYPVGAELRADHYCFMKNQPRFVARPSSDPTVITFELRGITNLSASPQEGHMHATTWRFVDADHLTQEWHVYENGKEVRVSRLEFTRLR